MSNAESEDKPVPDPANRGGTIWDWPNQQVIPTVGMGPGIDTPPHSQTLPADAEPSLDAMTKAELLAYAAEHGVEADDSMTKADIKAAIEA